MSTISVPAVASDPLKNRLFVSELLDLMRRRSLGEKHKHTHTPTRTHICLKHQRVIKRKPCSLCSFIFSFACIALSLFYSPSFFPCACVSVSVRSTCCPVNNELVFISTVTGSLNVKTTAR